MQQLVLITTQRQLQELCNTTGTKRQTLQIKITQKIPKVIYPSNKEGHKQQTLYHVSQSRIDIKSNQRGKKCIEATPSHPRN